MSLFSLRHRKALLEGRIEVFIPVRLRNRLWATMGKYDESYGYQPDPNDSWVSNTTLLRDTALEFMRLAGLERLLISLGSKKAEVSLEEFFKTEAPPHVLDIVEQFYHLLSIHYPNLPRGWEFQREVNEALTDFECPWILSEGRFFKIETDFLHLDIVQGAEDELRRLGFSGALDEFRAARDDLTGADHKDAILKAAQSVESTLKIVTGSTGDLGKLSESFRKSDFLDDIPQEKQKAVAKTIFEGLGVLRNELGGHGQGSQLITVERPYAALAVRLSGALTHFVIEQHLRKNPPPPLVQEAALVVERDPDLDAEPDDIPF
jgi:hypothetical protein